MKHAQMTHINRRSLLKGSGALILTATIVPACSQSDGASPNHRPAIENNAFNIYIEIDSSGTAKIYAPNPEIGQGVKTALPMIVAEELDIPWDMVKVEQSPISAEYNTQSAGGSMSVSRLWEPLREAGATARSMLVSAAAAQFEVSPEECHTKDGYVYFGNQKLSYGELAKSASELEIPDVSKLKLKETKDFALLGKRITGVDNLSIVTGTPLFGVDQAIPNMHYASYTKCPSSGGIAKSANLNAIRSMPGIVDAFILEGKAAPQALKPGVAIVGTSTWAVFKAKRALKVEWDKSNAASFNWDQFLVSAKDTAQTRGQSLHSDGNADAVLKASQETIKSVYSYPFLPHAPLEPQNCTAHASPEKIEIWATTQSPTRAVKLVASTFDVPQESVILHQIRAGGGFGRRLVNDCVAEAVAISLKTNLPIKVQWDREDDFADDFYRPGGVHCMEAAIDTKGNMTAFRNHFVTFTNDGEKAILPASYPGRSMPQDLVKNYEIEQTLVPLKIPLGWWRAPISNAFAFTANGFLAEVAELAGKDYGDFLLGLMGDPKVLPSGWGPGMNTGRAADVIRRVCEDANWGQPVPKGRALGLGYCFSHNAYAAEVADVEVFEDKSVRIHNVWVAMDVGPIVNMSGAEHQCVGSVIDGVSTMMGLEVDIKDGAIQQQNFDRYPIARMPQTPEVNISFIQSDNPPSGLGEPALPPIAPAICHAIFKATGERIRDLPISKLGYSFST